MSRRLPVAGVAAVLLVGLLAPAAAADEATATQESPAVVLPAPTGPHPVGVTALHLVDSDRPDPWRPEGPRELMVSVWYPTFVRHGARAAYTTEAVSAAIVESTGLDLPPDILTRVRTNARADVPILPKPGGWPLVVLSPGGGLSRESLTSLAEDLASRGYVVAGVDHPNEAVAVEFPDGRVAPCLVCEDFTPEVGKTVAASRALDVGFVLDELTGPHPAWPGGRFVDRTRIGMAGHSIGGASAAVTMAADSRVDAGINLDGTFPPDTAMQGLDRPFLMLGSGRWQDDPTRDETWQQLWDRLDGWRRWLVVTGSGHNSFTDQAVLIAQLGIPTDVTLPVELQVGITRDYVAAFFDQHLRGRPQPLLDGPSDWYPDVVFWK